QHVRPVGHGAPPGQFRLDRTACDRRGPGRRSSRMAARPPLVSDAMRWAGLRLAVTLLTAIPLRGRGPAPTRGSARTAMTWAPVIGLLLGGAAAGVIEFCTGVLQAGPLLAAVLAVAALAALTRGLHLDGLGSRRPAAMALDIMQRSDIGPYGVATLVLTLLIQVTALATAQERGRG